MKVAFSAAALDDIGAQRDWLLALSPGAATRMADVLDAKFALLREYPRAGHALPNGDRETSVKFGRDGFVVRYRVERDRLTILRVLHGRQDR